MWIIERGVREYYNINTLNSVLEHLKENHHMESQ